MVSEQVIYKSILQLHHQLTSTKHSSRAEEHFKGEHCEICASMQELYVLHNKRVLQLDVNWRRRSHSTNSLATHHTGRLALMTD